MSSKPNIVYFVADQMRADVLAHLGNPASVTPNLDALVQEGVSFRNAYCQNPVCVPSRCSFLTGLYPHTTGHRTIHYLQNPGEPNFLRTMRNQGYEVIWVGRNDLIPADRPKTDFCDAYYDGRSAEDQKAAVKTKSFITGQSAEGFQDPSQPGYYSHFQGKLTPEQARSEGMSAMDWTSLNSALDYLDRKPGNRKENRFSYILH